MKFELTGFGVTAAPPALAGFAGAEGATGWALSGVPHGTALTEFALVTSGTGAVPNPSCGGAGTQAR